MSIHLRHQCSSFAMMKITLPSFSRVSFIVGGVAVLILFLLILLALIQRHQTTKLLGIFLYFHFYGYFTLWWKEKSLRTLLEDNVGDSMHFLSLFFSNIDPMSKSLVCETVVSPLGRFPSQKISHIFLSRCTCFLICIQSIPSTMR